MNLVELGSRFYSFRNLPIRYIVLHTTEGTDSRTWLTETGNVSAHYLVRENLVYRLVGEDWAAWHAGIISGEPTTPHYSGDWENIYENGVLLGGGWTVNPNDESIGIEIEGRAAQPLSDAAVRSTAELIRDIHRRRGPLPLVSHSELSPGNRSDPGVENRQRIEALTKDNQMTREEFQALFLENLRVHVTPTLDDMKDTYNPLVAKARDAGIALGGQDQRIQDLESRLAKLREI